MLPQGTLDRYCTLVMEGYGTAHAAAEIGITTSQIKDEARRNPTFLQNLRDAQEVACDKITLALFKNAEKGNLAAQKFYLTNKRPSEYQESNQQNPNTNQIQVNIGNMARQIAANPEASKLALEATHQAAPRFTRQLPAPKTRKDAENT